MNQVNVTSNEAAACLALLKSGGRPRVAADIAEILRLGGSRESQRRHVRAIIKQLREDGEMIVATLQGGYWLTDDDKLWREYLEGRKIDAKKTIGQTHKRIKAATDSLGQGLLFGRHVTTGLG
jgi:biotin operon repressor